MTPTSHHPKTGLLLLNMGGPGRLEDVRPFLTNLFSDPDIIRLPFSFLLQKPLARYIVRRRGKEAEENYRLMGGASPQLPLTREQADALAKALGERGHPVPIYLAMRYWHPFTEEALDQIVSDGIERLLVLTLYPHFSYTTTGSSLNELRRVMAKKGLDIPMSVIDGYALDDRYLAALAECVRDGLEQNTWGCPAEEVHVLFSAHSLPLSHVKRTKDPYPDHVYQSAKALMERYFPKNDWDLCYQSKVGKMPWLGPYTDSALTYLAAQGQDNALLVPISFVTDHVETLVEIDRQYIPLANELGMKHCHRAPALNSRPAFISALAGLVAEKLSLQEWTSFPENLPKEAPPQEIRHDAR